MAQKTPYLGQPQISLTLSITHESFNKVEFPNLRYLDISQKLICPILDFEMDHSWPPNREVSCPAFKYDQNNCHYIGFKTKCSVVEISSWGSELSVRDIKLWGETKSESFGINSSQNLLEIREYKTNSRGDYPEKEYAGFVKVFDPDPTYGSHASIDLWATKDHLEYIKILISQHDELEFSIAIKERATNSLENGERHFDVTSYTIVIGSSEYPEPIDTNLT